MTEIITPRMNAVERFLYLHRGRVGLEEENRKRGRRNLLMLTTYLTPDGKKHLVETFRDMGPNPGIDDIVVYQA